MTSDVVHCDKSSFFLPCCTSGLEYWTLAGIANVTCPATSKKCDVMAVVYIHCTKPFAVPTEPLTSGISSPDGDSELLNVGGGRWPFS
jgi:hypothetical protein